MHDPRSMPNNDLRTLQQSGPITIATQTSCCRVHASAVTTAGPNRRHFASPHSKPTSSANPRPVPTPTCRTNDVGFDVCVAWSLPSDARWSLHWSPVVSHWSSVNGPMPRHDVPKPLLLTL